VSDNGFIPLALPETEIAKAQLRPVDETLSCIPGDLTPCRAVLVR